MLQLALPNYNLRTRDGLILKLIHPPDFQERQFLPALIDRMDQGAVKIAQGIYVLHPEKHKELIELATNTLRSHGYAFVCVTTSPRQEQQAIALLPLTREQHDKMDSWPD